MNVISIRELLEHHADVKYIIEPILPRGGAAVIGGGPGDGKTFLELSLALAIASGQPWLGRFLTIPGKVLIVDEENALTLLKMRLEKLARASGMPVRNLPILFAIGQGLNLSDPASVEALTRLLTDKQVDVVMIDSFVRVHRANENAANEIAEVLGRLKILMTAGITFVFTHHNRKPGMMNDVANSLRGSSDIRAFVDTQLAVRRAEQELIISHEKARWTEPIKPFTVRIADTPNGGIEVACVGTADLAPANETDTFILDALADSQLTRKRLVEMAAAKGIPQRTLDRRLKALCNQKKIRKSKRVKGETLYELVAMTDDEQEQGPAF